MRIHIAELEKFLADLTKLYRDLTGEAKLDCMFQNLNLTWTMQSRGRCQFSVSITPDHLIQEHTFRFMDFDQTYIPKFIRDLQVLLRKYRNSA